MIAVLGDIVFEVSSRRIFTFKNFTRTGAPRLEEHNVIGRKPVLERAGAGLDKITFDMRLDIMQGVDVEKEIKKLHEHMTNCTILQLTTDCVYKGEWIISNLQEAHKAINNKGVTMVADINISLTEVADGLFS